MTIMRVLVEKLLCQTVMRRIPVLKCLLSSMRGCLRLRLVLPGIKWHRYRWTPPALWPLARCLKYPRAYVVPGSEDKVDWTDKCQNLVRP
jgi:hypothetical protein